MLFPMLFPATHAVTLDTERSHTHVETPMPPIRREVSGLSRPGVAQIDIWITDSFADCEQTSEPSVHVPSWARISTKFYTE